MLLTSPFISAMLRAFIIIYTVYYKLADGTDIVNTGRSYYSVKIDTHA